MPSHGDMQDGSEFQVSCPFCSADSSFTEWVDSDDGSDVICPACSRSVDPDELGFC